MRNDAARTDEKHRQELKKPAAWPIWYRMAKHMPNAAAAAVLDDHVIRVYVQEMENLVADVVSAHIFDSAGRERWSNVDNDPALEGEFADVGCDGPVKRPLAGGHVGFDFPLTDETAETLILRLRVDNLDPPSLKYVASAIAPALECLSRQIRIDTDLTSRITVGDTQRSKLDLADALNRVPVSGSIAADVQNLLDACQGIVRSNSVIVHLPAKQMTLAAPEKQRSTQMVNLAAKLFERQQATPRPFSVGLTLPNRKQAHATCAPIVISRGQVDGVAIVLSSQVERKLSTATRLLAGRIAALISSDAANSRCCNRYDLLKSIGETLNSTSQQSHSLIYFNIDKTHAINDAFGYSTGDKALARCQQIVSDCAGANDVVGHLGSDRYALFLPGASIDTAVAKVDQILRFLAQESIEDGRKSINLSASAGVACSSSVSKGGEELLILAEVAARGARDRGGGQYATFQDVDNSIIQRRSDVDKVGFLQTALIENKFTLHAQRIQPVNAHAAHKFELLARLTDKNIDNGSAHQFLAAAERYQMMAALDRWVINSALKSLSEAEDSLEVSLSTFCINVSAQSLQDDSFVDHIEARIADSGVPPDALCFEITETSLVRYIDRAQHFVSRLQRMGCQVALDDFGTGYSSFGYLKTLPINILKIDGSFVRDILECKLSKTIVRSVVLMAADIGALTVAEHVETELVRAQLKELGVHYVQGYVVHRPEPLENILSNFDTPAIAMDDTRDNIDLRSDELEALVSSTR